MITKHILYNYIGHPNGNIFNMDNEGSYLRIFLNDPTPVEIKEISSSLELRMGCFPINLWFTLKFGNLPWAEAPFTPHYGEEDLISHLDQACSTLEVSLVNTSNGELIFEGKADIPKDFKAGLVVGCAMILMNDFDDAQYKEVREFIQSHYDVNYLANTAILGTNLYYKDKYIADSVSKGF